MVFFVLAIIGVLGLMYYITIELNELEKKMNSLLDEIRKHYESQ
jgi:hypothetical protein